MKRSPQMMKRERANTTIKHWIICRVLRL